MWETFVKNSNAVIAVFTMALVFTTIVYTWVTCKLLKQSKNAFLADMVLRMMEIHRSGIKERVERKKRGTDPIMEGWTKGYRKAFMEVDKKLGTDLLKLLVVGMEAACKAWIEEARKEEGERKKIEEEKEKLEKKLKEIQDLERPKND